VQKYEFSAGVTIHSKRPNGSTTMPFFREKTARGQKKFKREKTTDKDYAVARVSRAPAEGQRRLLESKGLNMEFIQG
jgi:hypothetical protein